MPINNQDQNDKYKSHPTKNVSPKNPPSMADDIVQNQNSFEWAETSFKFVVSHFNKLNYKKRSLKPEKSTTMENHGKASQIM